MGINNMENLAKWLLEFKRAVPVDVFDDTLRLIAKPDFKVEIKYTNETGFWEWAIIIGGTECWLEAKDSEQEARDFCALMGWKIAE